jgi:hypothetical protein
MPDTRVNLFDWDVRCHAVRFPRHERYRHSYARHSRPSSRLPTEVHSAVGHFHSNSLGWDEVIRAGLTTPGPRALQGPPSSTLLGVPAHYGPNGPMPILVQASTVNTSLQGDNHFLSSNQSLLQSHHVIYKT